MKKYKIAVESIANENTEVVNEVERSVPGMTEREKINYSPDSEADKNGDYFNTITIGLECVDGIGEPFSKELKVISNNNQTGFEVDAQRKKAIKNFITEINK